MIRRTFAFIFFLLIGIGLFVSIIASTGLDSIADAFSKVSLWHFLLLLGLSLLNFGLFTWRWDIILHHHHSKRIPFWKLYLHRMSGFAVSYLTPAAQTGGEPVRLFFLKQEGVDTKTAVSSIVIDKVFEITALIFFIFSGIIAAIIKGSLFSNKVEIMLGITIILFIGLVFWFYYSTMKKIGFFSSIFRFLRFNKIKRIAPLEEKIVAMENQMTQFYTHDLRKFIFLLILSFVMVSFMVLEHFLVAYFLGVKLSLFQAFLAATIPGIAYMIPIPGAIGTLESSHAGIFALLGISINVFVFVLILRLRDLVFILIGLTHASKEGIKMIRDSFFARKNGN